MLKHWVCGIALFKKVVFSAEREWYKFVISIVAKEDSTAEKDLLRE